MIDKTNSFLKNGQVGLGVALTSKILDLIDEIGNGSTGTESRAENFLKVEAYRVLVNI